MPAAAAPQSVRSRAAPSGSARDDHRRADADRGEPVDLGDDEDGVRQFEARLDAADPAKARKGREVDAAAFADPVDAVHADRDQPVADPDQSEKGDAGLARP